MATSKDKAQVHHMLRTISFTNVATGGGALPVEQVDADVQAYLEQGYELAYVHYAGETSDGLRILYVLVKHAE